jgi:hypothetical protein
LASAAANTFRKDGINQPTLESPASNEFPKKSGIYSRIQRRKIPEEDTGTLSEAGDLSH